MMMMMTTTMMMMIPDKVEDGFEPVGRSSFGHGNNKKVSYRKQIARQHSWSTL